MVVGEGGGAIALLPNSTWLVYRKLLLFVSFPLAAQSPSGIIDLSQVDSTPLGR